MFYFKKKILNCWFHEKKKNWWEWFFSGIDEGERVHNLYASIQCPLISRNFRFFSRRPSQCRSWTRNRPAFTTWPRRMDRWHVRMSWSDRNSRWNRWGSRHRRIVRKRKSLDFQSSSSDTCFRSGGPFFWIEHVSRIGNWVNPICRRWPCPDLFWCWTYEGSSKRSRRMGWCYGTNLR